MPKGVWKDRPRTRIPPLVRFMKKVVVNQDGCWIWTSTINGPGYGTFGTGNGDEKELAHRMSWILHNGPIPDGLYVLHRCDVRKCVNPAHLFLGTQKDNIADMLAKGRGTLGTKVDPEKTIKGTRHGMHKLTESEVLEIRRLYDSGEQLNKTRLAEQFNVTRASIRNIVFRRNWTHLETERVA